VWGLAQAESSCARLYLVSTQSLHFRTSLPRLLFFPPLGPNVIIIIVSITITITVAIMITIFLGSPRRWGTPHHKRRLFLFAPPGLNVTVTMNTIAITITITTTITITITVNIINI
jgi:hypothetical protein